MDRSIVSGWQGGAGQMVNLTGNVGNLVTTWDNTGLHFSSLSAAAQDANTGFVKGVYCFLGGGDCATQIATSTPSYSPTPTLTMTSTVTSSFTSTATWTSTSTHTPTWTVSFTPTASVTFTVTPTSTVSFTPTPTSTATQTPWVTLPDGFWISRNIYRPGYDHPTLFVRIDLSDPGTYRLKVYNSAGELVKVLRDVSYQGPIDEVVAWDGRNEQGQYVAAGMYIVYYTNSRKGRYAKVLIAR